MSKDKQVEACQHRINESLKHFYKLQEEARNHAKLHSQLAMLLNQFAEKSPAEMSGGSDPNTIFDDIISKIPDSHPSKEQIKSILGGLITVAGTLVHARKELQKLKAPLHNR